MEHRSRHKRLGSNHSQAIDFRDDLCVIGQIVELCSAVRLSVFVRLHVEGEVKQFILETIKKTRHPRALTLPRGQWLMTMVELKLWSIEKGQATSG